MLSRYPKVDKRISPEPNSGCWLWTGGASAGYARLRAVPGRTTLVYRLLWEDTYGPVPQGLELDHKCRVRLCVNPEHMEPVTRRENIRRGVAPIARQMMQTHCIRGHPLFGDNLYTYRTRYGFARKCKACKQLRRT